MVRAIDSIRGFKYSKHILLRFIYQCFFKLLLGIRLIRNAQYRSEIYYSFLNAKDYHQKSSFTFEDRYPDLFTICKDFSSQKERLNIMSFGCSTGEEVKTLSEYFPKAKIIGADINNRSIRLARSRYKNDRLSFVNSLSNEFEKIGSFDLLLCCAVFQTTANRTSVHKKHSDYAFSKFESTMEMLDRKVSKNGLLVIDHCDFSFLDTKVSQKYKALSVANNSKLRRRPCYNNRNEKISDTTDNDRVFLKIID